MLTMIIQRNLLMLNAVMYTAQNESEAVPSWRVYFFPTERERKKKRESLSSCFFFFCFVKAMMTNIQYCTETRLSFFLFVLTGVCDEEHVLSLSVVEEEVCRKREESNVARFFYLRFAFSRAKRSLFLRGFKGDDDHKIYSYSEASRRI